MDALDQDRAIDEIDEQLKAAKIAGLKEAIVILNAADDWLEAATKIRSRIAELEKE